MKLELTLKQLLEAGVHFGHQTQRWNPKMRKYIFGSRNGIYIVDLEKTIKCIQEACNFLGEIAKNGSEILFVGTKRQAKESIKDVASQCKMPYVTERWLGGTLTNFETIRKSITRMEELEKMDDEGTFKFFTKKEAAGLRKERDKLHKNLEGIRNLKRAPGALFVIDPKKEENAVKEAIKLNIPVVALIDTNSDPDMVTYPLPGNDDAIRSIKLIANTIGQAVMQARQTYLAAHPAEDALPEGNEVEQLVSKKLVPISPITIPGVPISLLSEVEEDVELTADEDEKS